MEDRSSYTPVEIIIEFFDINDSENIDVTGKRGAVDRTPLYMAARVGAAKIVKLLLVQEDVNVTNQI